MTPPQKRAGIDLDALEAAIGGNTFESFLPVPRLNSYGRETGMELCDRVTASLEDVWHPFNTRMIRFADTPEDGIVAFHAFPDGDLVNPIWRAPETQTLRSSCSLHIPSSVRRYSYRKLLPQVRRLDRQQHARPAA